MAITKVSNSVLNLSGNTDALGLPKGTDAQRPTPVAGMLRFNTETSGFEGYDGTEWGAIGGTGSTLVQDEFTGDGTTVAFTLSVSVVAEIFTSVYISGVYQEKNAYSISGTTLTFSVAPPNGSSVEVITIDNIAVTAGVSSVNGETGIVSLDSDDISEGSVNLYNQTHTGEVIGSTTLTIADDVITYAKLANEFTDVVVLNNLNAALDIDFSLGTSFTLLADQSLSYTLTFTNYNIGDVKSISCTVASTFGLSFNTTGKTIVVLNGEIDPNVDLNFIQVACVDTNTFYLTISSLTP